MFDVYITKAAKYLPNDPVANDDMEAILGMVNNTPSKARRLILRNNGIKSRYYAINRQGEITHNNAQLTTQAVNRLYDENFGRQDVELISCGTSSPDHIIPSHTAMVHGLLGGPSAELNSSSGVCCAGMNALKFGYLSVKSGNTKNAVCTGSERSSTYMQAGRFEAEIENLKKLEEQPVLAFQKDFLRWMLSDGAGAFLLQNKPAGNVSLKIEWMEAYSFAGELEACMYNGGNKMPDGTLKPWQDYEPNEWLEQSLFSLRQDVKLLDKYILEKGTDCTVNAFAKHGVDYRDIDYLLPHVSSDYFVQPFYKTMLNRGIDIPVSKWFMNLTNVGNVGAASIYLMVEELMNSGRLKKGEKILLIVPESARFTYALAYLTVC